MAQRITRLTTDQKIPGSNPGKLGMFCIVKQKASTSMSCRGPLWAQCPPKMVGGGGGGLSVTLGLRFQQQQNIEAQKTGLLQERLELSTSA